MSRCLIPRACLHLRTSKRVLLAPQTAAEAWSQGASHPGRQHQARQGRVAKEGQERVERGKSIFTTIRDSPKSIAVMPELISPGGICSVSKCCT